MLRRSRLLAIGAATLVAAASITLAATMRAEAATTTYQAESATLSGGAAVATDHSGYTGSGFVAGYVDGNQGRAATAFTVGVSGTAQRTLTLRYANGTGSAKTLSLYVNGTRVTQVSLNATANWDSWGSRVDTVTLNNGTNSVAYRFDSTDSGNVNLDSLVVADVPAPPAGTYEAESAALSGGATVATDHSGYSGTGFVGGYTDGNRGNAATTFSVSRSGAGSSSLTLRYANGTGSAMTLSLYVNGSRLTQVSLPATANWDTWGTRADTVTLNNGTNSVAYRFDGTDSGNVNLDNLVVASVATSPTPSTSAPPASGGAELETAFLSGGATTATSIGGYTGTGYATGFTAVGARAIRTVNVTDAGNAATTLRYTNSTGGTKTLSTYANGVKVGQISLTAGSGWLTAAQTLPLRAGLNLIGYQYDSGDSGNVALDNVAVAGSTALAARGATVAYTEYEAENGSTNATTIGPDRAYLTVAAEASGRRAVRLDNAGKYVQFTLTKPTNSLVVRASVPDNAAGTGTSADLAVYAGGAKVKDLPVSSAYSWVYGAYPYDNNPAGGEAHRFFDEFRTTLPSYPAGTVLKLQNDGATPITVDLVDTEVVAPALTAPANSLSIVDYGATSGGGDDTNAFNTAVQAAKSQGKTLWLPAGTWDITSRITVDNVTVRGAGMWHTTVRGANGKGGFFATGPRVQLADFTIAGDVRYRDDTNFDAALEGNFGTGSLLHNLWIEHTKVGLWASSGTDGLYAAGLRIRDTFADGVNLNGDLRNTRVDQSVLRNTGDDALAMWSNSAPVTNSAFTFNTAQLPMLANTAAIYGGRELRIEDNLFSDTVYASSGIAVSTWHGAQPFAGTTSVQRNTLTRTGGYERNWGSSIGALWFYAEARDITTPVLVRDVDILDSSYQGLLFSWQRVVSNVTFDHVRIAGAGTYGIEINVTGSATFNYVTVSGAASGGLLNNTGYTLVRGPGNSGF
ncbi:CBM35 domain-containing protein [Dactylosporangium sp. NPDC050588]|uniref:CBM35 domain-containing protein n=1 Tax=Dactylosporangium sp. NPDC050588 TaxID=3157211 RepID=UPI0033C7FC5A